MLDSAKATGTGVFSDVLGQVMAKAGQELSNRSGALREVLALCCLHYVVEGVWPKDLPDLVRFSKEQNLGIAPTALRGLELDLVGDAGELKIVFTAHGESGRTPVRGELRLTTQTASRLRQLRQQQEVGAKHP